MNVPLLWEMLLMTYCWMKQVDWFWVEIAVRAQVALMAFASDHAEETHIDKKTVYSNWSACHNTGGHIFLNVTSPYSDSAHTRSSSWRRSPLNSLVTPLFDSISISFSLAVTSQTWRREDACFVHGNYVSHNCTSSSQPLPSSQQPSVHHIHVAPSRRINSSQLPSESSEGHAAVHKAAVH